MNNTPTLINITGNFPLLPLHTYVEYYAKIGEILDILRPYDCVGVNKIRLGGGHDGGYIMLPPELNSSRVAYSFGVSNYSPWDTIMANLGFQVYQYDGTIEAAPEQHPNLFFHKYNIAAPSNVTPDTKTVAQIFQDLGHQNEDNIILQIDIEHAEWAVFEELTETEMLKFSQIIIEWHGLTPSNPDLDKRLAVLRKVAQTHTAIHVHLNNWGVNHHFGNGIMYYGDAYEVTYVRTRDFDFTPSTAYYPTELDKPCHPNLPDIPIGQWK